MSLKNFVTFNHDTMHKMRGNRSCNHQPQWKPSCNYFLARYKVLTAVSLKIQFHRFVMLITSRHGF